MSRGRPFWLRLAGLTTALALGLALWAAALRWLALPADGLAPADAIVVLGGEYPGRVRSAVELFDLGVAPELWITGDTPRPGERVTMADVESLEARLNGVLYEQQRLLASTSTVEDAEQIYALAMAGGARHLVIVTSWYHSRRALCVLRRQFADTPVRVSYAPALLSRLGPDDWWRFGDGWYVVNRELAAVLYYALRYDLPPWKC